MISITLNYIIYICIDLFLKKYSSPYKFHEFKENQTAKLSQHPKTPQNILKPPQIHPETGKILTKIDTNLSHLLRLNAESEKNNIEIFNKIQTEQQLTSQASSMVSEYLQTEVLFQKKPEKINKIQRISTLRSSNIIKNSSALNNSVIKNRRYLENSIDRYEKNDKIQNSLNKEAMLKIFSTNPQNMLLFKKEIFKEKMEIYKNSEYILISSRELLDFFKYSMIISMNHNNETDFWKNMEEFIGENKPNNQNLYNNEYKFLGNLNENKIRKSKANKSCEFSKDLKTYMNKSLEIRATKNINPKEKTDKCSIF